MAGRNASNLKGREDGSVFLHSFGKLKVKRAVINLPGLVHKIMRVRHLAGATEEA